MAVKESHWPADAAGHPPECSGRGCKPEKTQSSCNTVVRVPEVDHPTSYFLYYYISYLCSTSILPPTTLILHSRPDPLTLTLPRLMKWWDKKVETWVLTWTELVMVLRANTVAQSLMVDWLSNAPWVSTRRTATWWNNKCFQLVSI